MANINNLKIGADNPDAIMFNTYYAPSANQGVTFSELIPKDNSNINPSPEGTWEINDGWEVTFVSSRIMRIDKFKIDTWGIRHKVKSGTDNARLYTNISVKVDGLSYINQNVIKATPNSEDVTGFVNAYSGTLGYIVEWFPGQNTSGKYVKGLVIQGQMCYVDAWNTARDNSYAMGRAPWEINTARDCMVADGTRPSGFMEGVEYSAICIGLFGGCQSAKSVNDISNGAYKIYDISDHPIYIYLDVPDLTQPIDVSSKECWDINIGDTKVYHKDRTAENCWKKFGMITEVDLETNPGIANKAYHMDMAGIPSEVTKPILPNIVDLEEHILPKNTDNGKLITWRHTIANTEFWDNIKQYLLTHPVICVESLMQETQNQSKYTYVDNNNLAINCKWFAGSGITGDLTIKFDGHFSNQYMPNCFTDCNIDTLTFQFLQDNLKISVTQYMFKQCSIKNIRVLDKEGNPSNNFLGSRDCSGMCEFNQSITYFPDIIDWTFRANIAGYYQNPIQYAWSYCSALTEIAQHGDDREGNGNMLYVSECAQAFQYCASLIKIGPVLDMGRVNISEVVDFNSAAYRMFQVCYHLSDVRIKNLNGSYVNFDDDDNQHGRLPALDEDSIKYLFNNLTDLSTFDESISISSINNNWLHIDWLYIAAIWSAGLNEAEEELHPRSYSGLVNARRVSGTSEDKFYYTTKAVNMTIKVTGLQSNDELIWKSGDTKTTLSNNVETIITNVEGSNGGFILRRIGSNVAVDDYEHAVTINITKAYSASNPKAPSAQLHCPSEWFGIFNLAKWGSIEDNRGKVSSNVLTATGRIAPASNNSVWISVKSITSIKFKVEGLVEGDTIAVGRGNLSEVANKYAEDGTYTIDEVDYNPTNNSWGIKLFNENTSLSDEVTVTILQVNNFTNKVTSEMIAAANAKNWHIYVDGTEKVN